MKPIIVDDEPIHGFFELSYASYLVLPRTVLQSMPTAWQRKFVDLLEQAEDMVGDIPRGDTTYYVSLRDNEINRFITDPLKDYERGRRRIPLTIRADRQVDAIAKSKG